jgi:hypothetical protein
MQGETIGGIVKLDEADMRVGMALEMDAIRLQAQLDGINRAARFLADEMYNKYGINRDEYQLTNWLIGFEPVGFGALPHGNEPSDVDTKRQTPKGAFDGIAEYK